MRINSEIVSSVNIIGDIISGLGIGIKEAGGNPDELLAEIKPGAPFLKELGLAITDHMLVEVVLDTRKISTDWKTPISQLLKGHFFNGVCVRNTHCVGFDKAMEQLLNNQDPLISAKYRIFRLKEAVNRWQWQNFLRARDLSAVMCRELFAIATARPSLLSGFPSLISPVCDLLGHRAEVRETSATSGSSPNPLNISVDNLDTIFSGSYVVAALPRHGR